MTFGGKHVTGGYGLEAKPACTLNLEGPKLYSVNLQVNNNVGGQKHAKFFI